MDEKEIVLKSTIEYLTHLSNNIGSITTEYDWKEICRLVKQLEETFSEYKLIEYLTILKDDLSETNNDW